MWQTNACFNSSCTSQCISAGLNRFWGLWNYAFILPKKSHWVELRGWEQVPPRGASLGFLHSARTEIPAQAGRLGGSVLSLWHWEFWPSLLRLEAVTILSACSPVTKETEEIIFSTQSSLEKNKSLLFIFKNRMKFGALTSEKPCTSTTGWCLQSQSLSNSFVGFGAAADIRWESCQDPVLSQRLMPYKLACFHKPCWEPHHAFVPVLLIITSDSDAYQGADDMQDKQQGFSKVVKCWIFQKYLN